MMTNDHSPTPPPSMYNMGGSVRQKIVLSPVMEDTVNVSLWYDNKDLLNLFRRLEIAKRDLQKMAPKNAKQRQRQQKDCPQLALGEDGVPYFNGEFTAPELTEENLPGTVDFGGEQWVLRPYGIGGNNGKPYFDYILQNNGITIMLRPHASADTVPNGLLELGSIPLTISGGLSGLWPIVLDTLAKEGIEPHRHVVGRYDLCIDVLNLPFSKVAKRYRQKKYICTAWKWEESELDRFTGKGEEATGFSIGKALRLNCYDKIVELEETGQSYKHDVLIEHKWDGEWPENVTRFEFQCKRDALKAFLFEGIGRLDTVDDCIERRSAIWHYLTTQFFRMLQGKIDKKNRNHGRANTWRLWERISKHGSKTFKGKIVPVKRKRRRKETDAPAIMKQSVGCTAKCAVYDEWKDGSPFGVLETFLEHFDKLNAAGLEETKRKAAESIRDDKGELTIRDLKRYIKQALLELEKKTDEVLAESITTEKLRQTFIKGLNEAAKDGLLQAAAERQMRQRLAEKGKMNILAKF